MSEWVNRTEGTNPQRSIFLEEIKLCEDILIVIQGGDAHIGAVPTAYQDRDNPASVHVETTSIPGHKENLLTDRFALQCARKIKRTVTVIMGIHFDGLTKAEIDEIVRRAERMLDNYLEGKMKEYGIDTQK